ncbi:hypothetical protein HEP74_01827 [Xanthomonas sp. SS]|nr:hypothetical protein HEP74_01827 [Xanthomonas sp. SS]
MQREDRRMLQQRSEDLAERDGSDAASAQAQQAEGYAARVEGNLSATPAPAPAAMPAAPIAADTAPLAASARASGTDPALAAAAQNDARLSPRRWLARIRERRDAGEQAAARASLQRFQREHPHARIPDDLRELLGD